MLGLGGDPTPGMVESVQALAKEFGDFSHDVQSAWSALNSFGGDATALSWVGQTADAFKAAFGPLPGRLQKLYVSYGEASDALTAYWPKMQAAQNKADIALRQGQDAESDVTRATGTANNAAADLKTAQAGTDPKTTTDAQTAHDNAQKALSDAKGRLATLAAQAEQAHDDLQAAGNDCAKALHHAQSDGIHNKHWWQHVGEVLSEVGGQIAQWAGEIGQIAAILAPILNGIALLTVEIPGLDVVTASLAAADDVIAETAPEVVATGTAIKAAGDGLQGHWKDLGMDAAMLGMSRFGGKGKAGDELENDGLNAGRSNLTPEEEDEMDKMWADHQTETEPTEPSKDPDADAAWADREAQNAPEEPPSPPQTQDSLHSTLRGGAGERDIEPNEVIQNAQDVYSSTRNGGDVFVWRNSKGIQVVIRNPTTGRIITTMHSTDSYINGRLKAGEWNAQ